MMYEKCKHCVNSGKVCQMIIAPSVCALEDLELTTNRGLQYSKQRIKAEPDPIRVKMDFTCLDFKQRENDPWEQQIMQNQKPYDYNNLRTMIHNILYSFFDRELECNKGQEFDFEFMESTTDEILRLIKCQGGQV